MKIVTALGAKVVVIRDSNGPVVNIHGYGVYEGIQLSPMAIPSPKLKLENGKVMWGYECHWLESDRFDELFKGYDVRLVE